MHTLHMRSYIMHKSRRNVTPFETCAYQKKWLWHADLFLHNALFVQHKFQNSTGCFFFVFFDDTVNILKANTSVTCMDLH